MRRVLFLAFVGLLLSSAISTPPVQAGEAGASTPLASVALEVADASFEVTGCATPKVIAVVSGASPDVSCQVQLYARLVGTAPTRSEFLFGDGNAREEGNFLICEGAGDWIVSGTFTSHDYALDLEFKVALESSFKISKAVTKTTLTRVRVVSSAVEVSGQVTSISSTFGVVGAPGEVLVQVRPASRGKWIDLGTAYAGSTGNYVVKSYKSFPKGSSYRARYMGSDAVAASSSAVTRS